MPPTSSRSSSSGRSSDRARGWRARLALLPRSAAAIAVLLLASACSTPGATPVRPAPPANAPIPGAEWPFSGGIHREPRRPAGVPLWGSGTYVVPRPAYVPPRPDPNASPPPAYPEGARRRGEEGCARVLAKVASDGSVLEARVEGSSGSLRLDGAALEAVRRWRFLPALDGEGRPSGGEALVPFRFALEP